MHPSPAFAWSDRGIVGDTMTIDSVCGTRKLSHNRPPEARSGVFAALADSPREDRTIAATVRAH